MLTLVYTTDGKVAVDGGTAADTYYAKYEDAELLDVTLDDDSLSFAYKIEVKSDFALNGSDISVSVTDSYLTGQKEWVEHSTPATTSITLDPVGTEDGTNSVSFVFAYVVKPNDAPQDTTFSIGAVVNMERA